MNIYPNLNYKEKKYYNNQLILSCYHNVINEVIRLCIYGTDVNCLGNLGMTPLFYAAMNGHLKILQILCDNHAIINKEDINGMTPLMHACENGHFNVVVELCIRGANIKHVDKSGWDAALSADANGHKKIYEYLLEKIK